jgi:o-succinylbenzoate synthase
LEYYSISEMLEARYIYHPLVFKRPAGTSRGELLKKETWFLIVSSTDQPGITGIGEAGLIPGLSIESPASVEQQLNFLAGNINSHEEWIITKGDLFPSVRFALETAIADLTNGGSRLFYDSPFYRGEKGIPINGLVWMGEKHFMQQQARQKLENGFSCIKIKIGALDIQQELEIIEGIRSEYDAEQIQIRVDANGAFSPEEAIAVMIRLSELGVHSIEQPVEKGQWKKMAELCKQSPLPIALDEELTGIFSESDRRSLLETIRPAYIVLKPGLLGGVRSAGQWAELAKAMDIGWWVTSALESNIGLNAIAQWTAINADEKIQGLGTGQLFQNNFDSPLTIKDGKLFHYPSRGWELKAIENDR